VNRITHTDVSAARLVPVAVGINVGRHATPAAIRSTISNLPALSLSSGLLCPPNPFSRWREPAWGRWRLPLLDSRLSSRLDAKIGAVLGTIASGQKAFPTFDGPSATPAIRSFLIRKEGTATIGLKLAKAGRRGRHDLVDIQWQCPAARERPRTGARGREAVWR
jgi:hypothetical protein